MSPAQKKYFLIFFFFATLCLLWSPQFQRSLWHDEELVAFGARSLMETGSRKFIREEQATFENLAIPHLKDGDLPVVTNAENLLAIIGFKMAVFCGAEHPWRWARWPFAFFGIAQVMLFTCLLARYTKNSAVGLLAALLWLAVPWVWTLSVQLKYYPVTWFLLTWGLYLWLLPVKRVKYLWVIQLVSLYYINWTVCALFLLLLLLMQRVRDKKQVVVLLRMWTLPLLLIVLHAFVLSDTGEYVLNLSDKTQSIFWILKIHLAEFNLNIFPLLLIAVMLLSTWKVKKLQPFLLGTTLLPLFFVIPSLLTRHLMMFLPLLLLTLILCFNEWANKRPFAATAVLLLWTCSYVFQNLPVALIGTVSPKASVRLAMPLNRDWQGIYRNSALAWQQVRETDNDFLEEQAFFLKEYLQEGDHFSAAMDATTLQRLTGLTVNWKKPQWAIDSNISMADNFNSPQGIKAVIVRAQWPYVTRGSTWSNEIVQAIEEGWIKARRHTFNHLDLKYNNYPFAFSQHRQSWPRVKACRVWLLDKRVDENQAKRLMSLKRVDVKVNRDDMAWGLPLLGR